MEKSKDQIHLVDFLGISSLPIEGKQSIVSLTEPLQPCLDKSMTVLTQISKAMFDLHSQHEIIHRNLTFKSIAQSLRDPSVVKVVNFEYACKLKEDQFLLVLPKDDLDEGFLFAGRRSKSQISEEEEKVESQKSQNRQYNKHVAPELIANQENRTYNRKIDVFAFGQLMFDFLHEKSKLEWTHEDKMLRRLYERCVCANPEDRPEFEEIHTSLQREFPFAVEPRTSFSTFTKDQMSLSPTIGTSASIGHIRRTMEDSLCVMESADRSSIALAVFDGLRQGRTSEFAAKRFPFLTFSTFSSKKQMEDNLISSLAEIDRELTEITPTIECGSTATCALVNQKELALAWLGDSSAFLVRKKRAPESSSSSEDISKSSNSNFHAISLITKHAPDREDELVRIDKSQGSVGREMMQLETGETVPIGPWRVFATESASPNIGIAISRSLGLFPFRPSISNQPEVVKLERKPKEDYFLVIASDGL
jgi:serine/threonine protein phosphatase PrpC